MNKSTILSLIEEGRLDPFPLNRKSKELLMKCLTSEEPWCEVYLETLVEQGILPKVDNPSL